MKKKTISTAAIALLLMGSMARSQTTRIRWTSFDMGFSVSTGPTTQLKVIVGQTASGLSKGATFGLLSGFMADSLVGSPATDVKVQQTIPKVYALMQNFPNPFNAASIIQYEIPWQSKVQIVVYNILGQLITTLVNDEKQPGTYSVIWNARSTGVPVSTGVYFYRMHATGLEGKWEKEFTQTKKLILMK